MIAPLPNKEEFTTAMHSELTISKDVERKLVVFTALDTIMDETFTEEEALEAYGVTKDELELHRAEHLSLL